MQTLTPKKQTQEFKMENSYMYVIQKDKARKSDYLCAMM